MVGDDLDMILETIEEIERNAAKKKPFVGYQGDSDEELIRRMPVVKIMGVGGAGNNTVTNLMEAGIKFVETIAVNTDAQQLLRSRAHKKVLIGDKTCGGFGAGTDPSVGEAAALESKEKIEGIIRGTDLLFVTCGLGGGTGSGATPVITEIARDMGIVTVAVCTLPFSAEGFKKMEIAAGAIKKIIETANTTIIIPNDKLLEIAPKATLLDAFRLVDNVLVKAFIGISEMVNEIGVVNLEFSDVRRVLSGGGTAVIGIGEANTADGDRAEKAVANALSDPLLDFRLETAKKALINIVGGKDITLEETAKIIDAVTRIMNIEQEWVKWGIMIDDNMNGTVRATVILAGIELPYVDSEGNLIYPVIRKSMHREHNIKRIIEEFGIEVFE